MTPFVGILFTSFVAIGRKSQYRCHLSTTSQEIEKRGDLSKLCGLFGASPTDLLSLRTNPEGIRGVYVKKSVCENDVILKIPLESCLRDDSPPQWLQQQTAVGDAGDDDVYAVSVEAWVTKLTACLLQAQFDKASSKARMVWLDLLPTNLRQILPIHWDSTLLESTQCRALELAVDSAFFARAGLIGDLLASLRDSNIELTQNQVEDALDLVQTRSCRVQASDGKASMRVLVPIFDLINHSRDHNAEFFREGDSMVVRALKNIDMESELYINYGDSTQPAWKCLFSYGFVPRTEDVYEDDVAELIVDDLRFEIGPTEIPFELVQYEAERLGLRKPGQEGLEFTSEIGQNIIDRVVNAAKGLATIPICGQDKDTLSSRLLADLRQANQRTLLACAGGLREYIKEL